MDEINTSLFGDVQVALSWEIKEVIDIILSNFMNTLVFPLRVAVFINQKGTDTFEEFGVVHETLGDPVLHLEHFLHIHVGSSGNLLENNSACQGANVGFSKGLLGLLAELRIRSFKSGENVLNRIGLEDFLDFVIIFDLVLFGFKARVAVDHRSNIIVGDSTVYLRSQSFPHSIHLI